MAASNPRSEMAARTFIGESIEGVSLARRIRDLLVGDATSNFVVAMAIVIGFFHGWLKLRYRHPLVTFAFDIPLMLALAITFGRVKTLKAFLPDCRTGRVMRIFYAVTAISFVLALVLPWGAPLVVALAAVRGWLFSTLMFGLGYHLIGSRRQFHAYLLLILVLSAITGYYASRQTLEEVDALARLDPYFEMRLRGVKDVDDSGQMVLRRFSTFVSSGAFGGTMAVALVFLAALVTDRTVPIWERLLLLGLGGFIGWGLFLSGSRTSMIQLGLGLAFVLWIRRLRPDLLLLLAVCAVAFYFVSRGSGGGVTDRFSRFEVKGVLGRFYIVWAPGVEYLLRSGFIGGGLGKAAVGLPAFLFPMMWTYEVWGVDGDLGKVMAEMGVIGTGVIIWLLIVGFWEVAQIALRHRQDSTGTMAIAAGGCFLGVVLTFPTGSPFLGIPLGVLSWFFLGAVVRLDHVDARNQAAMAAAADSGPRGVARAGAAAMAAATSTSRGQRSGGQLMAETAGSLTQQREQPNPRAGRERMYLHYRKGDPKSGAGMPKPAVVPPPTAPMGAFRQATSSAPPAPAGSRPAKNFLFRPDFGPEGSRQGPGASKTRKTRAGRSGRS